MKVRGKLFTAMAVLILLMGGSYFTISHGYMEGLFRQYASAAAEANAEQWARLLAYYYQRNNQSWTGVNQYVIGLLQTSPSYRAGFDHISLDDAGGHSLLEVNQNGKVVAGDGTVEDSTVSIVVGDQKIGSITVGSLLQSSPVEQNVLQSMTIAGVWGTILTSLVALAVGIWLVRLITQPLRIMSNVMGRVKSGDMTARMQISSHDEFGEVGKTFNEMADKLHTTEEARRRLVADVAHELRTPLTIIQGQLELIQEGVRPAEPATMLPIQDEVSRLIHLVQDLHQLSLAEVGKLPLNKTAVDIVSLVQRVVANFEVEAEDRQVTLNLLASRDGYRDIEVDASRITQVLVNIVGNALSHTKPEGSITVTVRFDEDTVTIAISDTGVGIAQEHLQYVFDRFYRAEDDRSRASGGTGLGLAIAKEFVEAHHGRIEVQSALGEGTTFTIYLPTA